MDERAAVMEASSESRLRKLMRSTMMPKMPPITNAPAMARGMEGAACAITSPAKPPTMNTSVCAKLMR